MLHFTDNLLSYVSYQAFVEVVSYVTEAGYETTSIVGSISRKSALLVQNIVGSWHSVH